MTDPIRAAGRHPLKYQKPNDAQVATMQLVDGALADVHDLIVANIPSSRERSLAITKLEEVYMWANKAIAFSEIA